MNINLTPEQKLIVNDELKSGHFRSAEEVIAQALIAVRERNARQVPETAMATMRVPQDASLALQWFLEDEPGRQYGLNILASLSSKRAVVPTLWFYEVGNGLLMAYRRKRITFDQIEGFLTLLKALPMDAAEQVPTDLFELTVLTRSTV